MLLWQLLFGQVERFAAERLLNIAAVKMNDREFDDSNVKVSTLIPIGRN